jgi:hypothetical protein
LIFVNHDFVHSASSADVAIGALPALGAFCRLLRQLAASGGEAISAFSLSASAPLIRPLNSRLGHGAAVSAV